jgi:protein-S-isoprenylcysteine O-methyltransferase Ste14
MRLKTILASVGHFALMSALLFVPAGTLAWPAAWVYLAILYAATVVIDVLLLRHHPGILAARLRAPIQRGQPVWDKIFVAAIGVLFLAWLPLIGLDAERFRWSHVPIWLQGLGALCVVACLYVSYRTFRVNAFGAPVVRIQAERGHRVISTGPYARVRHPMYSGALLFFVGTPLLLGSWWGLAAAPVLTAVLALRAVLEERTLTAGLEGYADYMRRVRYRLVPGVW